MNRLNIEAIEARLNSGLSVAYRKFGHNSDPRGSYEFVADATEDFRALLAGVKRGQAIEDLARRLARVTKSFVICMDRWGESNSVRVNDLEDAACEAQGMLDDAAKLLGEE